GPRPRDRRCRQDRRCGGDGAAPPGPPPHRRQSARPWRGRRSGARDWVARRRRRAHLHGTRGVRPATGLIVGRCNPPHPGRSHMIEWAAARCDRLVVFVNTRAGELVPGPLRAQWLAELHPDVTVVEVAHDLDTNFGSEALWTQWMELFRSRWPHATGPDVVFS